MEQQLALLILGDLDPYPPNLTRRASPHRMSEEPQNDNRNCGAPSMTKHVSTLAAALLARRASVSPQIQNVEIGKVGSQTLSQSIRSV